MKRNAQSLLKKSIFLFSCSTSSSSSAIVKLISPNPNRFSTLFSSSSRSHRFSFFNPTRNLSSGDHNKEIDEINLKFAEAREEIESALDSKETVYFDEEAECAREAVKVVLDMFDGLLERLPENEKMALQRSMGLKILQLKAELQQLNE